MGGPRQRLATSKRHHFNPQPGQAGSNRIRCSCSSSSRHPASMSPTCRITSPEFASHTCLPCQSVPIPTHGVATVGSEPELFDLERQLRDFALGVSADLSFENFDCNATPVDFNGVTNRVEDRNFSSRSILGISGNTWEPVLLDGNYFGDAAVTRCVLVDQATSADRNLRRVVWTVTWTFAGDCWEVVNSHAGFVGTAN